MAYLTSRRGILITAAIISLLLYFLGVFSGLYATKFIKQETEEDLRSMRNYVDILDKNLRSIQLEQLFTESLEQEERCRFASLSVERLVEQLGVYWERLPFRIEAYERGRELSEEYGQLKEEYTELSLRTWIIAKDTYQRCSTDLLPLLYFYTAECEICVSQGEELDLFQKLRESADSKSIVFTVDLNAKELLVDSLRAYYNITSVPSIIVNEKIYQGDLIRAEELLP